MGLDTGSQLITKSRQQNSVHVRKMVKKCSEKGKKWRKTLRGLKRGHINKEKELEPKESYVADGHQKDNIFFYTTQITYLYLFPIYCKFKFMMLHNINLNKLKQDFERTKETNGLKFLLIV